METCIKILDIWYKFWIQVFDRLFQFGYVVQYDCSVLFGIQIELNRNIDPYIQMNQTVK